MLVMEEGELGAEAEGGHEEGDRHMAVENTGLWSRCKREKFKTVTLHCCGRRMVLRLRSEALVEDGRMVTTSSVQELLPLHLCFLKHGCECSSSTCILSQPE
jgi:hypothetical protein